MLGRFHVKQHYDTFWARLEETKLDTWRHDLPPLLDIALDPQGNGNLHRWLTAMKTVETFPKNVSYDLNQAAQIGRAHV